MKILVIFLAFSCFLQEEQQIILVSHYKSPTVERHMPIVLVFQGDSVRTYIHELGYLWWKIEYHNQYEIKEGTILKGKFDLTYKEHHSHLVVRDEKITQIVLLKGTPSVTFLIEFTRRPKKTTK